MGTEENIIHRKSNFELYEKIQIAATFEAERSSPQLFQLLGYRRAVAEKILDSGHQDTTAAQEILEHTNKQIRLLLGI